MKLARYLFKPDWQSKDAATRRAAIETDRGDDAELAAALPRLAREDDDAGVRLVALKRVADPVIAQTLAKDDADSGVRSAAHVLWLDLLAGTHKAAPTLAERLRMLGAQDDSRVIEHIARHGVDSESRAAALARVERSGLIGERAVDDPDPQVRLNAVERIDNEAQLERIAERTRKTDKRVNRRAREKIDALRLARNDSGTIAETATSLCERIEHLLRHGDDAETEAAIEAQWAALGDQIPAALAMRFDTARHLLEARRDPEKIAFARERAATIETIETELLALEHDLGQAKVHQHDALSARFETLADRWVALADASLTQRKANERRLRTITSRLADLAARKPAVRVPPTEEQIAEATRIAEEKVASEARRARAQAMRAEFAAALSAFELALESGNSANAHAVHATLTKAQKECDGEWDSSTRKRLERAHKRYQEIAGWQRWSVTKRRRELSAEMEGLASAGLHPDAVATRVREAQAEWTRLDATDKSADSDAKASAGSTTSDHLARHFRKVCRLAIEPVRPYFEKRDELRQSQRSVIDELVRRAGAESNEPIALRDLVALRRDCAAALRTLDGVEPRERKVLAEQLKSALGALDTRISEIEGAVETAKVALIGEAEQLGQQTDEKTVASGARELQRRWQAAGQGRRKRDDAQWKLFRGAIDGAFANVDAVRAQGAADAQRKLDDAMALCVELEQLSGSDEAPERGAVTHIDDAWRALAVNDETLRRRYRDAQSALRDAADQRARRKHRARYDHWLAHYHLCRALERGELTIDATRERQTELPSVDLAKVALGARFERAIAGKAGDSVDHADDSDTRDCLISLEQLAGLESPPEDRQRRLDLQVARLSEKLRGKQNEIPEHAFETLLTRWVGNAATHHSPEFDARFERAYRMIVESL